MPTRLIHAKLDELPREVLWDGALERTAVRGDDALVTINWLAPQDEAQPPHRHPFDQLAFVVEGAMEFTVGEETVVVRAGEVLQIPADVPHTGRAIGEERVLNIDVFAPLRRDYLHLVAHQADAFAD
jgi:quercetin dioxygenase-like cupin family protein